MAKGKLKDIHRRYIIERLACFDSPKEIADDLKKEFGVDVGLDSIMYYDPTTANGAKLAPKWKELFAARRESFKTDLESIPIANKAYRLRRLQRMAANAEARGNAKLAKELLEQAAKETGGAYTNRKELSGPGGKEIPIQQIVNPAQVEDAVRKLLDECSTDGAPA